MDRIEQLDQILNNIIFGLITKAEGRKQIVALYQPEPMVDLLVDLKSGSYHGSQPVSISSKED